MLVTDIIYGVIIGIKPMMFRANHLSVSFYSKRRRTVILWIGSILKRPVGVLLLRIADFKKKK